MRHSFSLLIAGSFVLGSAITANAQNNGMAGFGAYPAGITTGSPYGANWSGFYGLNPGGVPLNTYYQPYNAYGANYTYMSPGSNYLNSAAPGMTSYNSAYTAPGRVPTYGYAPGTTTTYGRTPGYTTTYPNYSYGSVPTYNYNTTRRNGVIRGMFGNRR